MANEKKFLDSSGIGHLWDRIEERYPNMDELGLIIDAIDEVKANKTDIVQADWNQNDETAPDYIKNRTHWYSDTKIVIADAVITTEDIGHSEVYYHSIDISRALVRNGSYLIEFNGEEYRCYGNLDTDNIVCLGNQDIVAVPLEWRFVDNELNTNEPFFIGAGGLYTTSSQECDIKIYLLEEEIHKLESKYLINSNIVNASARGSMKTIYTLQEQENYMAGAYSFAEGYYTHAEGEAAHAEGSASQASGDASHAEGDNTIASGDGSHAEGWGTKATASASHAEGAWTLAMSNFQHVQGKYNIEDSEGKYVHIVGNGRSHVNPSNAHTLDWQGNAWFAGDIYVGGASQDDVNSHKVLTEKEITSPKNYFALTDIDNGYTYIVQMKNGNLVSRCGVSSIKVTAMPDKIEYYAGEYFDDPTGMIVTATCEDGSVIEITNYTCSDNQFVIGANTVTISYNEAGNTYTTTITVNAIEFDAATILIDFEYTTNSDGTYTITAWKGTKNGVASTEMVVPNSSNIIL